MMSSKARTLAREEWAIKSDVIDVARKMRTATKAVDPLTPVEQPPASQTLQNSTANPGPPDKTEQDGTQPSRGEDTTKVVPSAEPEDTHQMRGVIDTPRKETNARTIADERPVQPLRGAERLPVVSDSVTESEAEPNPEADLTKDPVLGSGKLRHKTQKHKKLVLRGVAGDPTEYEQTPDMATTELQTVWRDMKHPDDQSMVKSPFDDIILPKMTIYFANVVEPHREQLMDIGEHNLLCVAENVNISDALKIPAAKAAIQAEWDKLINQRCWNVETVQEYAYVKQKAQEE